MLDRDLSMLNDVETKVLKQAVKRNIERFPFDFMFELTKDENDSLRSQFVTLKRGQHAKYMPSAFTEQGIAMLSSVLKSNRAIAVNIEIMRMFTHLRSALQDTTMLKIELEEIKKKLLNHDKNIELVFSYLDEFIEQKEQIIERQKIGYLEEAIIESKAK